MMKLQYSKAVFSAALRDIWGEQAPFCGEEVKSLQLSDDDIWCYPESPAGGYWTAGEVVWFTILKLSPSQRFKHVIHIYTCTNLVYGVSSGYVCVSVTSLWIGKPSRYCMKIKHRPLLDNAKVAGWVWHCHNSRLLTMNRVQMKPYFLSEDPKHLLTREK